jgi:hypothetical protein
MSGLFHQEPGIIVWTAQCKVCGHVSGLARVELPDGRTIILSGAGCLTRRGPREALRWARTQRAA